MSDQSTAPRRRRLAAFLGAVAVAAVGVGVVYPASAGAGDTVKAQLSLSGVATADNPTGGSVLGIHPGDSVTLSAATVPTAGLDKLGLGDLVSGLLGSLTTYQVTADLHSLPGGKTNTVLTDKSKLTFAFPKAGTYNFTWSAQSVSVGLLGKTILPINLDGNQLAKAGVKLNAKNQYVGQIVVAADPPKGGISIQLPGVSVQPQVGGVTLPKIGLPGVTTPTITTTVPNLNPKAGKTTGKPATTHTGPTVSQAYPLPVPAMVVPQGTGIVRGTSNYGGGTIATTNTGTSTLPGAKSVKVATVPAVPGTTTKAPAAKAAADNAVNVSPDRPSSSGLPVVLAIVAMIALAAVAGAYARLFLLRKRT